MEAIDVYPKVECTDAVRWACYEDGSIILLNTEYNISQEAIVHFSPSKTRKVKLAPGQIEILRN
jgi:hypothetical protein